MGGCTAFTRGIAYPGGRCWRGSRRQTTAATAGCPPRRWLRPRPGSRRLSRSLGWRRLSSAGSTTSCGALPRRHPSWTRLARGNSRRRRPWRWHRDVEAARIGLDQADANLAYCTLVSPFSEGTVSARYIDAGERVAPNQKAFLVLDLSRVVIAFGVPDTLVARLSLGQEVDVTCDALPAERFRGVDKIASTADPQTRSFEVEIRIDEPRGLRPGMIATVSLRCAQQVCLLPLSSVVPVPGTGRYDVFRVSEEAGSTVVRRVAAEFDDVVDNRVAVRLASGSGLKPGDRVVATGTHGLFDGQSVQVGE